MLDKLKNVSVRSKLLLMIFVFFGVPSMIMGVIWNERSSRTIEKIAVDYDQLLVGQIQNRLDVYFQDLRKDLFPYLVHPVVTQYINAEQTDSYTQYSLGHRLQSEVFPSITYSRKEIYNFSLISANGQVFSSIGGFDPEARYRHITAEMTSADSFKIIGVSWENNNPIVTVAQKIMNNSLSTAQGLFVIDIYINGLTDFFKDIKLNANGFIWIVGRDGSVVFHPDQREIDKPVPAAMLDRLQQSPQGYTLTKVEGVKKLIYFSRSSLTSWIIVSEVPFDELTGNLIDLRNTSIGLILMLLLLALFIVGGFSFNMMSSLLQLQRLMKRVEQGDLNVTAKSSRLYIEIDSLNQGFNRMIGELRRLIEVEHGAVLLEKEMKIKHQDAILQMMQSQINPHFLYNTLEVVNSHAIVSGVMPISRMVTALAALFRYSLDHAAKRVSLKQEIEYMQMYFMIQQERNPYFQYDIDVDEDAIAEVAAVSLIVQPIVENAFIHGYERHRREADYIAISGQSEGGTFTLTVSDRGGGMSADQMEAFNRRFAESSEDVYPQAESEGMPRIGLWNVHQRIRLTFGQIFGLHFAKSDESGTDIEIRLPVNKG